VGALGIPLFKGNGNRVDAFQFCDTTLSKKVTNGFHAVALDEQRNDFQPSLWDPAPNVKQVLFPGAHCDVGGGYPIADNQCGLSDGGLKWMIDELATVGMLFSRVQPYAIRPSFVGIAHKPWLHSPWNIPGVLLGPRLFPRGMDRHPSIAARMGAGNVVAEPGENGLAYNPVNL
jgi:T6SS, Phospholipase effector Tle1-like, catalytic domain